MKIGFTGTREGYGKAAHKALVQLFLSLDMREFHHGCCDGSDTYAHHLAFDCCAWIVGYPGPNDEQRGVQDHELHEVKPRAVSFFARNRAIVNATDLLIATPRLMVEEDRGGTWYTIRYARKVGKTVYVVWPDGSVTA